jgi:diguanylate cyclase (GGDEF)-like protein
VPQPVVESLNEQAIGAEGSPSSMAAYFGDAVATTDIRTKKSFGADFTRKALSHGIRACLAIPVFSGKGQVLGTVALLNSEPHAHGSSDHQLLEMTAKLAAIAIEQRSLTERLAHLAHHDTLTGLPNRLLASDRLDGALARCNRHSEKTAIIYIDLDRFKHVNDSLGHQTGDLLLRQVADRLKGYTRKSDTLARMGGDEFLVILNRIVDITDVSKASQRILNALVTPFSIEGRQLHIGASIGISVFPDHGLDATELQRNADIAMYSAKNEGGNRYRYYTEEMNALVIERLEIENDLRKALERGEFELFFQPQFQLSSRDVYGVEALLRWNHPELGRIPPARFIPIAEETGLIIPIGSWVLRTACEQNRAWQDAGYSPFRIAVNVSALQVVHPGFVDEVAAVLAETGLHPRWLELEITESVLMRDMSVVARLLEEIRRLGVSVAIDDFGNGYSSMSYLQRLPVDCLKVDQSFIREIEQLSELSTRSRTLLRTFVSLASSLGVRLLAEGVENDEQFKFLNEIGCEMGQGFLLGVPMPAKEIELLCSQGWDPGSCHLGD